MIKTILSILTITAFNIGINAQNVNIPDANFKAYLVGNALINTNGDTEIQVSEATAFTGNINCPNSNISDLTGIEVFSSITYLYCHINQLTTIDVSNNINLTALSCGSNSLTSLDISQNTMLTNLNCGINFLTNLNLSQNTALTTLTCSNNSITSLDISANTNLISFSCDSNPLTYLNVANGNNTNFTSFFANSVPNLTCVTVDNVAFSTTNWIYIDATINFSLNCPPPSCTVTIPDANFKAYLVGNTAINTNGNTEIECSEASAFTGIMDAVNLSIADLTGIEAFTSLTTFYCNGNQLTTIDISNNINVIIFRCYDNQLSSLDVSNNPNITSLICHTNNLTSLDISNNTSLEYLWCYSNQITSLNLSNHSNLIQLRAENNALTSLNVANGNNSNFSSSNFKTTNNPNLTCITVDNVAYSTTNWTNIDVQTSFSTNCNAGPCTVTIPDANFKAYLVGNAAINTNGNTEIECSEASAYAGTINCNSQSISDLTGIESFTALTGLFCSQNSLTTLDVTQNTNLTSLHCRNNSISTLDVSNNVGLTQLWCYSNSISSLDVSNNVDLTQLFCQLNSISILDVSTNVNLEKLRCYNNSIGSLDVSNCLVLEELDCRDNSITSLDVSNNNSLEIVNCSDNSLNSLNVANGNNTNFNGNFGTSGFYATNNPNLTCITVDDISFSNTSWSNDKDPIASFSTNCITTVLVSSITVQGQGGITTITTQGGTLQMEATVLPANADDATYTWSVQDQSGSASIDANGLLTALTDGTVTVIAAANDASNSAGTTTITISNQSVGINKIALKSISIYPNPVKTQLFIELANQDITIIDYSGRLVKTITNNTTKSIDVSDLTQGIYILKVTTENGVLTNRFIKQ